MSGCITISIELELGWGMHDKCKYGHLSKDRTAETEALDNLLHLTDKYNIPLTFDVVGHLFHEDCDGEHTGPHPSRWWNEDPGSNQQSDPLFYAPDLISEIRSQEVEHEIATHTYSHLLADDLPSNTLDDELEKVRNLHSSFDLSPPTSIVMPRHQAPDYSVLSDHGINVIRKPIEGYSQSDLNPFCKFWWILTRRHPESTLQQNQGILETTATPHPSLTSQILPTGQSSAHPAFSVIPLKLRQFIHKRYLIDTIDRAVQNDSHVHLWTHVYNMANGAQWPPLQAGLSYLGKQIKKDMIDISVMRDLRYKDP